MLTQFVTVGLASRERKPDHRGMTLATTCPRCKTSFRVVADQLKLRRGMVRCGVCQNIFNGLQHLRYVEALNTPPSGSPAGLAPGSPSGSPSEHPSVGLNLGSTQEPSSVDIPNTSKAQIPPAFLVSKNDVGTDSTRPESVKINVPPIKVSSPPILPSLAEPAFASQPSVSNLAARSSDPESTIAALFIPPAIPTSNDGAKTAVVNTELPKSNGPIRSDSNEASSSKQIPLSDINLDDIYPSNRQFHTEISADSLGESTTLTRSDMDVHTAFMLPDSGDEQIMPAATPPRSIQSSYTGGMPNSIAARTNEAISVSGEEDAVDFFSSDDSHGTTHERTNNWLRRLVLGILILLFVIQGLLLARNWLSARFPDAKPALAFIAGAVGQTIEIPRNLSMLTIEGFDVQSTGRADILMVSAILRNQSKYAVLWPAMELTLTGVDGRPILRKVLLPKEYLNQAPTERGVPGNSEHPIRIGLQTEPIEAKGFSVNIFYP